MPTDVVTFANAEELQDSRFLRSVVNMLSRASVGNWRQGALVVAQASERIRRGASQSADKRPSTEDSESDGKG